MLCAKTVDRHEFCVQRQWVGTHAVYKNFCVCVVFSAIGIGDVWDWKRPRTSSPTKSMGPSSSETARTISTSSASASGPLDRLTIRGSSTRKAGVHYIATSSTTTNTSLLLDLLLVYYYYYYYTCYVVSALFSLCLCI